jgi:hypothetical protein
MNPFVIMGAAFVILALMWYTFYTQNENKKSS